MSDTVRVRFAPSPTGEPHVGNIRTAIFNWLFARVMAGSFVVRIEDTDQAREVVGAADEILDSLRWLGIEWDEGPDLGGAYGPYVQSERLEYYRIAVKQLIQSGDAYRCYCSPERLSTMRTEQQKRKQHVGYDGNCRFLEDKLDTNASRENLLPVVRFAMPVDGETSFLDAIRGDISFDNKLIDDFVILKSDGFPTYHLASVVDDHYMGVSHVLRAEEWLSSVPRHVRLYSAFGWELPVFAHLPMILAADRSKLSKRHGATSVLEYREMGYLPQAMMNFLSLLGWSYDGRTEIVTLNELVSHFSLDRISSSAAVFDIQKLQWMNGHYIRSISDEELAGTLLDYWRRYPSCAIRDLPKLALLARIVPLIKERIKTLSEAAPLISFFFEGPQYHDSELVQKKMDSTATKYVLNMAYESLNNLTDFEADSIETELRKLADGTGIKVGQFLGPLRIAVTGLKVSPPLFETMDVLGRDQTLNSISMAINRL